jgi:hypothetical protein
MNQQGENSKMSDPNRTNIQELEIRLQRETDYIKRLEMRLRARERVIEKICEQAKDGNALTKVTAKRILSWLANSPDNDPPELGFADRR